MSELDTLTDGYYWAKTKQYGVWRMLRKSTDRQTWGQPWKDMESGQRVTYGQIVERYSDLVAVKTPKGEGE